MSFSAQVKNELCGRFGDRHCSIAEIAAIINTCGEIYYDGSVSCVSIQTENPGVAKKYFTLVKKTFNINCEVSIRSSKYLKKSRQYCLSVRDARNAGRLLHAAGFIDKQNKLTVAKKILNEMVVKSDCCRRAYIRGSFISGGSLNNPEKTYHMEFVNGDRILCLELLRIINSFGLNAKLIERKGHYVAYVKEGENIVDLLNVMGAYQSLMKLENIRIVKDMRNSVNRMVNCETANINKTVSASVKQARDIQYISDNVGLGYLSPQLEDVARLRIQYPEASLNEIGRMLTPQVGKSGVNHRLRRITRIAEDLRGDTPSE